MLIVHTYYTSGMHELAKIFVESFSEFHANRQIPLVIEGVDLTDFQVSDLRSRYKYLHINQHYIPMEHWAKRCGVSLNTLEKWRYEVEHSYVTPANRAWKLLIAGDHRIKTVRNMLEMIGAYGICPAGKILAHFDIDTIFRDNIEALSEYVLHHDAALKLRPQIQPIKARITIDLMVIKKTGASIQWLEDWTEIIDSVPPIERPIGFGQSSCWEAYKKAVEEYCLQVNKLPISYGLPGRNKPSDAIWCGNVHKLTKDDCANRFNKELGRLQSKKE